MISELALEWMLLGGNVLFLGLNVYAAERYWRRRRRELLDGPPEGTIAAALLVERRWTRQELAELASQLETVGERLADTAHTSCGAFIEASAARIRTIARAPRT
jgi:hypothetical protein